MALKVSALPNLVGGKSLLEGSDGFQEKQNLSFTPASYLRIVTRISMLASSSVVRWLGSSPSPHVFEDIQRYSSHGNMSAALSRINHLAKMIAGNDIQVVGEQIQTKAPSHERHVVIQDLCVKIFKNLDDTIRMIVEKINEDKPLKLAIPVVLQGYIQHMVTIFIEKNATGSVTIDYYDPRGYSVKDVSASPMITVFDDGAIEVNIETFITRIYEGIKTNSISMQEHLTMHQSDYHSCGVFALHYMIQRFEGKSHAEIVMNENCDLREKRKKVIVYILPEIV